MIKLVLTTLKADLNPGNIILEEEKDGEPRIKAIIDWDTTGYFPIWWIWYHPSCCPALDIEGWEAYPAGKEPMQFRWKLARYLEAALGFEVAYVSQPRGVPPAFRNEFEEFWSGRAQKGLKSFKRQRMPGFFHSLVYKY